MSPGEWKTGAEGLRMYYGFHPSPFGTALVIATDRGLAGLAFADPGQEPAALADMQRRWPAAIYTENAGQTAPLAQRIFDPVLWRADRPLNVVMPESALIEGSAAHAVFMPDRIHVYADSHIVKRQAA